ncbi:Uncharacterised protein [Leminorella richardii]|uniref:DUF4902 domain-containing protein n=2 Tax=Leminorella richardii TaxID=158841 RepID=A0A2X4XU51_9GAMM|nr:Uncharacterised protein [Leminorella richardii]
MAHSGRDMDYRVYLSVNDFYDVQLSHLYSAAYEEPEWLRTGGSIATTISGYTEWVSGTSPTVSLGWDWELRYENASCRFVKTGPIFSNIAFKSTEGSELILCDEAHLQQVLSDKIGSIKWEHEILHHIT